MSVFSMKGAKITSLTGDVSYFYKRELKDYEGQDFNMKSVILDDLDKFLINEEKMMKVYFHQGDCFVNIFSNEEKSSHDLTLYSDALGAVGIEAGAVSIYDNYLTVNSEFWAILSVKEFCESISPLEFREFPDYLMNLQKIDKFKAKEKINLKRKLHYSFLFKGIKDVEAEGAYHQAEELLTGITTDETALYKAELFFLVKASTKRELDSKCDAFFKVFKEKNGKLIREERGLAYFFEAFTPGVRPTFKRGHELPSKYLSYFVPHHKDFLYRSGLAFESRSGNRVLIDLFDQSNTNFNALISGSSGQGKSMLANKLLKHELEKGSKALVLDLGNSFLKNSRYHDGVVCSQKFNPMQFRDATYLKAFVLSVVDEVMPRREQGKLFEEIKLLLENQQILSWKKFISELEKNFKGISYYFSEIEEYFTDEVTTFTHLTYCDLSNYPESMKAPMIIYLLECFKRMDGRKVFIFDECWHLLQKNAEYIAECFRTFRKHGASAIAISQSIDDFAGSGLGKVIIQNSFHKFLFKQPVSSSEFIDESLCELIDSVCSKKGVCSEFVYVNDTVKKAVVYRPTYLEYELFTSDRQDQNAFEFYMSEKGRFLTFKRALKNFTEIKYNTEVEHV